jgi:uncharacterized protein (TIGR02271 family)
MNSDNLQIVDGLTVYATDGTKLGTVQNYNPVAGYLDIRKGWLFPKDFFVPLSAVDTVTEDGITLNLAGDALSDERYAAPPTLADEGTGVYERDTVAATDYDVSAIDARNTLDTSARTAVGTAQTNLQEGEDLTIPVREEELVAGTQAQEQGRVHVHKDVVEEQQTLNVPVSHERVTVEHTAYRGGDVQGDDAFVEQDIDIPVMGEEVVAQKRVRGVEEVEIRKDVVTEQQQVTDTVRKEQVTVDGVDETGAVRTGNRVRAAGDSVIDDVRTAKDRIEDR